MSKRIFLYKRLIVISLCLAVIIFAAIFIQIRSGLPYEEEIRMFLDSLEYSALEDLSGKDAYITLDFENELWTLNNIFSYDTDGKLANTRTRRGVCTELCQATYEFIKKLFGDEYRISFLKGNENIFFSSEGGVGPTHYVIKVTPPDSFWGKRESLIIDPSYKIYDYLGKVQGYTFSEEMDSIDVFRNKARNITLPVGINYPLLLLEEKDYMLSLVAKKVDGKFNEENYSLVVFATKKALSESTPLILFVVRNGEFTAVKDDELIKQILDIQTARNLIDTVFSLFDKLPF